jgi:hypothetical protein
MDTGHPWSPDLFPLMMWIPLEQQRGVSMFVYMLCGNVVLAILRPHAVLSTEPIEFNERVSWF